MSGDPERDYFSEGVSEDVITELSRFPAFSVIARNSSFFYKGKDVTAKEIGTELGVEYVLEGSVRKSGPRVRVTAQLIEVDSSQQIWADRYDRELEDIFAVQDEVAQAIVRMLAVRMEEEKLELAKRKPPRDLKAYELWLQGKRALDSWTAEGNAKAITLFETAITADPTYARAYAGYAAACEWATWYPAWNLTDLNTAEAAVSHAHKALELDDTDYQPHTVLAWLHHMHGQYEQSARHLDRALALNPNDADNLATRAMILSAAGRPDEGRVCAEDAIRLNPHHPDFYLCSPGLALLVLEQYDEAIAAFKQAPDGLPEVHAPIGATYALQGRASEAAPYIESFMSRYNENWVGEPSVETVVGLFSFKRQRDVDLLTEGLLNAGLA